MSATESIYQPLPAGKTIRVLRLHNALPEVQLAGTLLLCSLEHEQPDLTYTAISYVCGDASLCENIVLHDLPLRITANANEVLRRLRKPQSDVLVWIDCICINQQDISEREKEVSFMHKIYASAEKVFVWLGPERDDSRLAMSYAAGLDAAVYNEELRYSTRSRTRREKTFMLDMVTTDADSRKLLLASSKLLARAWFSRVWIQQEASVCAHTTVACGNVEVEWDQIFSLGWIWIEKWSTSWPLWLDIDSFDSHRHVIVTIQRYRRETRRGFLDKWANAGVTFSLTFAELLINSAWQASSTDPRDKIYAIRSMVEEKGLLEVPTPNYRISWQELYIEAAKRILQKRFTSLRAYESLVLESAGIANQGLQYEVPSWVPDWRIWRTVLFNANHQTWCAGGGQEPRYRFEQITKKQRLRTLSALQGRHRSIPCYKHPTRSWALHTLIRMMDDISFLGDAGLEIRSQDLYSSVADRLLEMDDKNRAILQGLQDQTHVTGQSLDDAYARTLIAGTDDVDVRVHSSMAEPASQWRYWLKDQCVGEDVPLFMQAVERSWAFREMKFCLTKHHLMCLVPAITELSDVIVIVRSLVTPLVLRPVIDGHFLIVGVCYIHGMMENQASELVEEFNIKIDSLGRRKWRPEGDARRNGRKMDPGKYIEMLPILGDRWVSII